jgi:hypothetical protein
VRFPGNQIGGTFSGSREVCVQHELGSPARQLKEDHEGLRGGVDIDWLFVRLDGSFVHPLKNTLLSNMALAPDYTTESSSRSPCTCETPAAHLEEHVFARLEDNIVGRHAVEWMKFAGMIKDRFCHSGVLGPSKCKVGACLNGQRSP